MKALRANHPKGVDSLSFEQVPLPTIKPHECLIKVKAAGIIWPEITWDALYFNQKTGEPRNFTLGCDYAGIIEDVGSAVKNFKPGDEVFALTQDFTEEGSNKSGSIAEYTRAPETDLSKKPGNTSWVEAAAVPLSALTAYQALFDHAKLVDSDSDNIDSDKDDKPAKGKRVLLTGAAGGTGVWALQMARNLGAEVVCTASSPRSFELLTDLGASSIVNYRTEKLDPSVQGQFDVVLDAVGGSVFDSCFAMVKRGGWITSLTENPYTCAPHKKRADDLGLKSSWFIVNGNGEQLAKIKKWIEDGKLRPIVDKVYGFGNAIEAYRDGSKGHAHGKLVVDVAANL